MKENLFKLAAEVSVPLRGFVVSNAKEVIMFKMKKNVSVPLRGFVVSNEDIMLNLMNVSFRPLAGICCF